MNDDEFFEGFMSDGDKIETDFEQEIMEMWEEEEKTKDRLQRRGCSRIWIWLAMIFLISYFLMKLGII